MAPGKRNLLWPRHIVALVIALGVAAALLGWRTIGTTAGRVEAAQTVRLHVVAHSNGAEDQQLKLHVRDRLLPLVTEWLAEAGTSEIASAESAGAVLSAHEQSLLHAARDELRHRGASYGVRVAYELDDGGRLAAVKVVLGDGAGNNWFCVLAPPLCFSDLNAVERRPEEADPQADTVRFAWRWLDELLSRLTLPVKRVGQMDQNDVDANLAHSGPRDGDVGATAE